MSDGDGWNVGEDPTTGDFFTPGSPYEGYFIQYEIDGKQKTWSVSDLCGGLVIGKWSTAPAATDRSDVATGNLAAEVVGVTEDGVKLTLYYSFGVDDVQYLTDVKIENNSGKEIKNLYYSRQVDPDMDVWKYSTYTTYNKVVAKPDSTIDGGTENYAMVVARGVKSMGAIFFVSFDNRARCMIISGWGPNTIPSWTTADAVSAETYASDESLECSASNTNGHTSADAAIAIVFKLGDLAADATEECSYYTSLDPNVKESLAASVSKASAAEADATATTVTVKGIKEDQIYNLYLKDTSSVEPYTTVGAPVVKWVDGDGTGDPSTPPVDPESGEPLYDGTATASDFATAGFEYDSKGNIIFTDLEPDTHYVVTTMLTEDYLKKTGALPVPVEVTTMTAIDPMRGDPDKPLGPSDPSYDPPSRIFIKPTVYAGKDWIYITDLDPKYNYNLFLTNTKSKSTKFKEFKAVSPKTTKDDFGEYGYVLFTGLDPNTTYYLGAMREGNDRTEKYAVSTQHHWNYAYSAGGGIEVTCDISNPPASWDEEFREEIAMKLLEADGKTVFTDAQKESIKAAFLASYCEENSIEDVETIEDLTPEQKADFNTKLIEEFKDRLHTKLLETSSFRSNAHFTEVLGRVEEGEYTGGLYDTDGTCDFSSQKTYVWISADSEFFGDDGRVIDKALDTTPVTYDSDYLKLIINDNESDPEAARSNTDFPDPTMTIINNRTKEKVTGLPRTAGTYLAEVTCGDKSISMKFDIFTDGDGKLRAKFNPKADNPVLSATESTVVVEGIDSDYYYCLEKEVGGTVVYNYKKATEADGVNVIYDSKKNTLTYTGLTGNTPYVVHTFTSKEYTGEKKSENRGEAKITTLFALSTTFPGGTGADASETYFKPEFTSDLTSIIVKNLNPDYKYALFENKDDRTPVVPYRPVDKIIGEKGTMTFEDLKEDWTYYFSAMGPGESLSESLPEGRIPVSTHAHKWSYSIDSEIVGNKVITAKCATTEPSTCEYYSKPIKVTAEFVPDDDGKIRPTTENYIKAIATFNNGKVRYERFADDLAITTEDEVCPLNRPTILFKQLKTSGDTIVGDDDTEAEALPRTVGTYEASLICIGDDDTYEKVTFDFRIVEDDVIGEDGEPTGDKELVVKPVYSYVYPGTGIDRSKGYILYDAETQKNKLTEEEKKLLLFDLDEFTAFDDEAFKNYTKHYGTAAEERYKEVVEYKTKRGESDVFDVSSDHSKLYNYALNKATNNKMNEAGKELYIDMYTEKLVNNAGIKIAAYRTTDSGKWVAVESMDKLNEALPKLLDKSTVLTVTDSYDSGAKKPGTLYTFTQTNKRISTPSFKVNYLAAADEYGVTNGQFILSQTVSDVADSDLATDYEITFSIDGKNASSQGWGVWPSTGGVWVPGFVSTDKTKTEKTAADYTKAGKITLLIRTKAIVEHEGKKSMAFSPAGKVKKIKIATIQAAPKVKVDYNKEIVKVGKGYMAYFGDVSDIPDPLIQEVVSDDKILTTDGTHLNAKSGQSEGAELKSVAGYFATYSTLNKSSGISLKGYLTSDPEAKYGSGNEQQIFIWKTAAKTKPATVRQTIKMATRYTIPDSDKSLTVNNGKVVLKNTDGTVTYLVMSVSAGKTKWAGLPTGTKLVITPDSEAEDEKNGTAKFTVISKCNAKGGKEDDKTFAASEYYTLTIKYEKNDKNKWEAKTATIGEYEPPVDDTPEPTPTEDPTPTPEA